MTEVLFLFAPGAGAPSSSAWMQRFAAKLGLLGSVLVFDYPYQKSGKRTPDRLPVLIEAHKRALLQARAAHDGPVVLVGKSMGSRVGCHVSLIEQVNALVCFGYPLRAAGKSQQLRDEVLRQLDTPVLFVQGTRDPLCPLDLMQPLLDQIDAPHALHVVPSGDHSLQATRTWLKQHQTTQHAVEDEIIEQVRSFTQSHL